MQENKSLTVTVFYPVHLTPRSAYHAAYTLQAWLPQALCLRGHVTPTAGDVIVYI